MLKSKRCVDNKLVGTDNSVNRTEAISPELRFNSIVTMSLHLEHMTLLWISMARAQGRGADFVWAMLKR